MCVPALGAFLPAARCSAKSDPAQSIRIDQALASVPIAWDRPAPAVEAVTAGADGKSVVLVHPDAGIDAATLIADVGDPGAVFSAPQKSPDGAIWTLRLLGEAGPGGLVGRPLQLSFMTAQGPYAVTQTIAPPAP